MKSGKERNTIESAMAYKHIAKLTDLAARIGCSERSLRGWLKGEHTPSPFYIGQLSNVLDIDARSIFSNEEDEDMEKLSRRGLVTIFGAAVGAALLSNDTAWQRLESVLNSHVNIDETAIGHLNTITQSYWQLRTNFNSQELWRGANGHLDNVSQILQQSLLPQTRMQLCAMAGEVALMSGTMAHDLDDPKGARSFYKVGIQAAHESNSPALAAIIYGRITLAFNNENKYQEALESASEGARFAERANPTVRAWLASVKAETHANLHESYHSQRELDRAIQFNEQIQPSEYSYWSGFDQARLTSYQGSCYTLLEEYEKAENTILDALKLTPPEMSRRRATMLPQLAKISLRQGQIEKCCSYASEALFLAQQVRSKLIFHRLQKIAVLLQPYANLVEVKQFQQQLATASL